MAQRSFFNAVYSFKTAELSSNKASEIRLVVREASRFCSNSALFASAVMAGRAVSDSLQHSCLRISFSAVKNTDRYSGKRVILSSSAAFRKASVFKNLSVSVFFFETPKTAAVWRSSLSRSSDKRQKSARKESAVQPRGRSRASS